MRFDAEICVPTATVWLARFHFPEPGDHVKQQADAYWLDRCLTPLPANACACYRER
jgi:hypothetical protein